MKLLETKSNANGAIKIYDNREWNEYVVKFFPDHVHVPAQDYFTGDRDDATATAHFVWEADYA